MPAGSRPRFFQKPTSSETAKAGPGNPTRIAPDYRRAAAIGGGAFAGHKQRHFQRTGLTRYDGRPEPRGRAMKGHSRAGSVKSRRRKSAAPKRGNAPTATRNRDASVAGE